MAAEPPAHPVARLARAFERMKDRREMLDVLKAAIAPLSDADLIVVAGEQAFLAELEALLTSAHGQIERLGNGDAGGTDDAGLVALEAIMSLPEWEVAAELVATLNERRREQEAAAKDYENRGRDSRQRVDHLKRELDAAVTEGALVRLQQAEILRIDDLVAQIERALRELRYRDADAALARLDADAGAEAIKQLETQMAEARQHAMTVRTHAGVLLIQAPLARRRYEYSVLLRTASEPGANSINIQSSSTLAVEDRKTLKMVIDEITTAVDEGLTRRFGSDAARRIGALSTAVESGTAGASLHEHVKYVGTLMYRVVVPEAMQEFVSEPGSSLSITTNDLELPWELMHDEQDYLCLKRPVARMPMGQAFPRKRLRRTEGGSLRFLLLYSDPTGDLPMAEREVNAVSDALKERWRSEIEVQVIKRSEVSGRALNRLMASGTFDVIHYAGHAAFDRHNPDLSGLVLHGRELFFAQKIRRLLAGRPLVFINACESGRTANEHQPQSVGQYLGKPAEGLASAFLYGGALACIGSLWPIFDTSAEQFAIKFYNYILEGHLVGEAMRLARKDIKRQFPNDITWASFVLYGDPTFRLARAID